MEGRTCRLEPLDADAHADALHEAYALDTDGRGWTYLPYGPFASAADYHVWSEEAAASADPLFFAILDGDGAPLGVASYLRIMPAIGTVEVGHIHLAPLLQRTCAATEAMYLMMRRAFDELGYRRYEWKCDDLNAPSRRAAERLGFTYEGTHRQATIYKGRNRDTAWYSILDGEWSRVRATLEAWLDPGNFDAEGRQRAPLRVPDAEA
ncbi:MAG TPA: GNAT family protein [Longimicrobiales bacterium]|nr:GNAT family protein [Longimicrobiales bacterium]